MWIPVLTDIYFYPSLNSSWSDTTEITAKIVRSGFQIFSHFSWHANLRFLCFFGSKVRDYPTSAGWQDRRRYETAAQVSISLTKVLLLLLPIDCKNRLNPPEFSSKNDIVLAFHSHLKILLGVFLFVWHVPKTHISTSKSTVFWGSTFCFYSHIFIDVWGCFFNRGQNLNDHFWSWEAAVWA